MVHQSIRLPPDAGDSNTSADVLRLDGDASALMVDAGELRIGERLQDMTQVSNGTLSYGLFQYAFGSDESLNLNITGSFVEDERLSLSELDPVILGLINMSDAEQQLLMKTSDRCCLEQCFK